MTDGDKKFKCVYKCGKEFSNKRSEWAHRANCPKRPRRQAKRQHSRE